MASGRRRRTERLVVVFSGPEPEVRAAAAALVAAWDALGASVHYLPPPESVRVEVEMLRDALTADAHTFAVAVSNYLRGVAFWCDEPLKQAELHLRRTAYPLPDRAPFDRPRATDDVPPVTARHARPPGVTWMAFRPWASPAGDR